MKTIVLYDLIATEYKDVGNNVLEPTGNEVNFNHKVELKDGLFTEWSEKVEESLKCNK